MENKQKPSAVLKLVPDHHELDLQKPEIQKVTTFSKEMLRWPIHTFSDSGKEVTDITRIIYHRALEALTMIHPFQTYVSIETDQENKKLMLAKRTWADIYLEETFVLRFSHHTKKTNSPFYSLLEWPEIEGDWESVQKILLSWKQKDWISFFRKRIFLTAKNLSEKASKKRKDALGLEKTSSEIILALDIF